MNNSPGIPVDRNGHTKQSYVPAIIAKVATNKENASASSILYLGSNTTEIEVAAVNQHIALKWLTQAVIDSSVAGTSVLTAAGSENWDNMVQTNTIRRFVVPIAQAGVNSVVGLNFREGLYPAVAFKTFAGNGSVLTGQY